MSFDFDSLPPAKRDTFDFDSLPKAAEPTKAETPYSELSTWDLLKAGDVKGLLGRSGNYNTYQEVPAETETGEDYSGTDYERPDNYLATATPSTQNNLMRDIEAWGSELADKLGKVGEAYMNVDVASSFPNGTYNPSPQTAEGMEGLREAEWEAYETAARPAGMAAVTPFLPAPVRAAAGAVYLPKFASDIANSYSDNLNGTGEGGTGEEQGALGAALDTAKQTIVDPLTGLASTLVNDPRGLAERIQEHPAALWDEVLAPASILEIPARVGKAGYERYKGRETALNDTLTDTFDSLPKAPEEAGTGSYAGERIASHRLDTGRGAIDDYVAEAAEEFGVPAERIHQIIEQESGYNPQAVSEAGAQGLMQLMPGTAAEMGVESVFDPRENIRGGVGYYRRMLDMFDGDERKALAAYNAGPGNWEAGLGYADEVMGRSVEGTRTGAREVDLSDVPMQDIEDAGLANTNNTLKYQFRNLFDWARQEFGKDVEVSGGWRSEAHNAEVNGSPTSHHLRGNAIDVNLEMLTEAERERFFQKAREMGFNKGGDDMWHDRGSGLHAHLVYEDEGIPGTPTRSASTPRPRQGERYAEPEQTSGEIKDMFGRYEEEPSNVAYGAESEQLQKLNGYIEQLEKRRQEVVDAEASMAEKVRQVQDIERELDNAMEYRARMQEEMLSRMENVQNAASMETDMFGGRRYTGTAPDTYGNTIFDNTRRAERQRIERERNEAMASDYMRRMGSMEDYDAGVVGNRGDRRYTGTAPDTTLESMREGWKRDKQRGVEQFNTQIDSLQKELREQVEAEVQRMIDNPGGKGVQTGLNFSGGIDEMGKGHGDVTGRWTVSNNPQWYQDFHKEHGRPPRKGEYEQIAYENLMKEQDFAEQDRALRRMEAYRDEFEKNPMGNLQEMMDEVDSRIQYDIAGDGMRNVKRDIKNDVEASFDKAAEEQGLPTGRPRLGEGKPTGAYEGETVARKDILQRMRDLFGTIKLGRTPRGTRGFYDSGADVARVDKFGNWETAWHEVGHKIDSMLDLQKRVGYEHDAELVDAVNRKYGGNIPQGYSKAQLPAEGVAEFVKETMLDPESAKKHFPNYSKEFEKALQENPDLSKRVKEMQDMMRVDREQGDWAKAAGTITDFTKKKKLTEKDWNEIKNDFMVQWIDDKWDAKKFDDYVAERIGRKPTMEESLYWNARLAQSKGVATAQLLLDGKDPAKAIADLAERDGITGLHEVTMRSAMEKLADFERKHGDWLKERRVSAEKALSSYLVAQRIKDVYRYKYEEPLAELKAAANEAAAQAREAEAKEADIKARLRKGEATQRELDKAHKASVEARREARSAAHAAERKEAMGYESPLSMETYDRILADAPAELRDIAQDLWDLNDNLLKIMVHKGMLTEKAYKDLRKNGEHYCSLARDFPDDASMVGGMMGKGFINVASPIKKLKEYGAMWDVKDPLQNYVTNVERICSLVERNAVGQIFVKQSEKLGMGGLVNKVKDGTRTAKDSTFDVWVDGERKTYETTPDMYRFMQCLTPKGADNILAKFTQYTGRIFRAGATTANVAFGAVNMLRDAATATFLSKYGYNPIMGTLRGLYHVFAKDDVYRKFKADGTTMATQINDIRDYHSNVLDYARKSKTRRTAEYLTSPLKMQEDFNDLMETVTRVGLYDSALRKGRSRMEATFEARGGTLDFGRAGTEARKLNRWFPFFNAAIQGNALFMSRFKANPVQMSGKLFAMGAASLALLSYIRSDEEVSREYDEFLPYEKNMFWLIPYGKDDKGHVQWARIPKPFTEGMIGASLPERLADLHYAGDAKGIKNWAKMLGSSFIPATQAPPVFHTLFEEFANYSTFRERNIVPQYELESKQPGKQYGANTSEFAKRLGGAVGFSPRRIDHIGQGILAGAYTNANDLLNPLLNDKRRFDNPVTKRFTGNPYRSSQSVQDYYDRKKETTQAYNAYKEGDKVDEEDLRDYQRTKKLDKRVKKYNKAIREANENYDYDRVEELRRDLTRLLDEQLGKYDRR